MSTYVHRGMDGEEKGKYDGNKITVNSNNDHLVEVLGNCNVTDAVIHLMPGDVVYKETEKEAS